MVLLTQVTHKGYKVKMDGRGNKDRVFNKNCHSINMKSIQRMKRYTQIKLPSSRGMMAFAVIALPTLPPRAVIDGPPAAG